METLTVAVVDVIDHPSSGFIKAINAGYAEPLKATKRISLAELIELRKQHVGNFASIRLRPGQTNEVDIWFSLAPPRHEDENTEIIWETVMESAAACVVIVPHDNPQLQTDARNIIERLHGYSPVPFVILLQMPDGIPDGGNTLRQVLNISHETPIIEYETFSGATLDRILKFLLDLLT